MYFGERMRFWDPGSFSSSSRLHAMLRLIRIEHTLFSLPFAYIGLVLSGYSFGWKEIILSTLAVFGLRTAAMAYNNIADLDIDRKNPRTRNRPLVTGALGLRDAWSLVVLGSLIYYVSAALLNKYAFVLSPVLWITALSYPHAKKLHWLPHYHLGLSLALVIFGGSIAASGDEVHSILVVLKTVPWYFFFGVLFWVAGFDIYYSIMDIDFDRKYGLGSVPSKLGEKGSLAIGLATHIVSLLFFWIGCIKSCGGIISIGSMIGGTLVLVAENMLVFYDRNRIPLAFNLNLLFGVIICTGIILDYIL
jgi:4-hydroxybenzoate polyprenyltransferase